MLYYIEGTARNANIGDSSLGYDAKVVNSMLWQHYLNTPYMVLVLMLFPVLSLFTSFAFLFLPMTMVTFGVFLLMQGSSFSALSYVASLSDGVSALWKTLKNIFKFLPYFSSMFGKFEEGFEQGKQQKFGFTPTLKSLNFTTRTVEKMTDEYATQVQFGVKVFKMMGLSVITLITVIIAAQFVTGPIIYGLIAFSIMTSFYFAAGLSNMTGPNAYRATVSDGKVTGSKVGFFFLRMFLFIVFSPLITVLFFIDYFVVWFGAKSFMVNLNGDKGYTGILGLLFRANERIGTVLDNQLSLETVRLLLNKYKNKKYLLNQINFDDIYSRVVENKSNQRHPALVRAVSVTNKIFDVPSWLTAVGIEQEDIMKIENDKGFLLDLCDNLNDIKDIVPFFTDDGIPSLREIIEVIDSGKIKIMIDKDKNINQAKKMDIAQKKMKEAQEIIIAKINKAKNWKLDSKFYVWVREQLSLNNDFITKLKQYLVDNQIIQGNNVNEYTLEDLINIIDNIDNIDNSHIDVVKKENIKNTIIGMFVNELVELNPDSEILWNIDKFENDEFFKNSIKTFVETNNNIQLIDCEDSSNPTFEECMNAIKNAYNILTVEQKKQILNIFLEWEWDTIKMQNGIKSISWWNKEDEQGIGLNYNTLNNDNAFKESLKQCFPAEKRNGMANLQLILFNLKNEDQDTKNKVINKFIMKVNNCDDNTAEEYRITIVNLLSKKEIKNNIIRNINANVNEVSRLKLKDDCAPQDIILALNIPGVFRYEQRINMLEPLTAITPVFTEKFNDIFLLKDIKSYLKSQNIEYPEDISIKGIIVLINILLNEEQKKEIVKILKKNTILFKEPQWLAKAGINRDDINLLSKNKKFMNDEIFKQMSKSKYRKFVDVCDLITKKVTDKNSEIRKKAQTVLDSINEFVKQNINPTEENSDILKLVQIFDGNRDINKDKIIEDITEIAKIYGVSLSKEDKLLIFKQDKEIEGFIKILFDNRAFYGWNSDSQKTFENMIKKELGYRKFMTQPDEDKCYNFKFTKNPELNQQELGFIATKEQINFLHFYDKKYEENIKDFIYKRLTGKFKKYVTKDELQKLEKIKNGKLSDLIDIFVEVADNNFKKDGNIGNEFYQVLTTEIMGSINLKLYDIFAENKDFVDPTNDLLPSGKTVVNESYKFDNEIVSYLGTESVEIFTTINSKDLSLLQGLKSFVTKENIKKFDDVELEHYSFEELLTSDSFKKNRRENMFKAIRKYMRTKLGKDTEEIIPGVYKSDFEEYCKKEEYKISLDTAMNYIKNKDKDINLFKVGDISGADDVLNKIITDSITLQDIIIKIEAYRKYTDEERSEVEKQNVAKACEKIVKVIQENIIYDKMPEWFIDAGLTPADILLIEEYDERLADKDRLLTKIYDFMTDDQNPVNNVEECRNFVNKMKGMNADLKHVLSSMQDIANDPNLNNIILTDINTKKMKIFKMKALNETEILASDGTPADVKFLQKDVSLLEDIDKQLMAKGRKGYDKNDLNSMLTIVKSSGDKELQVSVADRIKYALLNNPTILTEHLYQYADGKLGLLEKVAMAIESDDFKPQLRDLLGNLTNKYYAPITTIAALRNFFGNEIYDFYGERIEDDDKTVEKFIEDAVKNDTVKEKVRTAVINRLIAKMNDENENYKYNEDDLITVFQIVDPQWSIDSDFSYSLYKGYRGLMRENHKAWKIDSKPVFDWRVDAYLKNIEDGITNKYITEAEAVEKLMDMYVEPYNYGFWYYVTFRFLWHRPNIENRKNKVKTTLLRILEKTANSTDIYTQMQYVVNQIFKIDYANTLGLLTSHYPEDRLKGIQYILGVADILGVKGLLISENKGKLLWLKKQFLPLVNQAYKNVSDQVANDIDFGRDFHSPTQFELKLEAQEKLRLLKTELEKIKDEEPKPKVENKVEPIVIDKKNKDIKYRQGYSYNGYMRWEDVYENYKLFDNNEKPNKGKFKDPIKDNELFDLENIFNADYNRRLAEDKSRIFNLKVVNIKRTNEKTKKTTYQPSIQINYHPGLREESKAGNVMQIFIPSDLTITELKDSFIEEFKSEEVKYNETEMKKEIDPTTNKEVKIAVPTEPVRALQWILAHKDKYKLKLTKELMFSLKDYYRVIDFEESKNEQKNEQKEAVEVNIKEKEEKENLKKEKVNLKKIDVKDRPRTIDFSNPFENIRLVKGPTEFKNADDKKLATLPILFVKDYNGNIIADNNGNPINFKIEVVVEGKYIKYRYAGDTDKRIENLQKEGKLSANLGEIKQVADYIFADFYRESNDLQNELTKCKNLTKEDRANLQLHTKGKYSFYFKSILIYSKYTFMETEQLLANRYMNTNTYVGTKDVEFTVTEELLKDANKLSNEMLRLRRAGIHKVVLKKDEKVKLADFYNTISKFKKSGLQPIVGLDNNILKKMETKELRKFIGDLSVSKSIVGFRILENLDEDIKKKLQATEKEKMETERVSLIKEIDDENDIINTGSFGRKTEFKPTSVDRQIDFFAKNEEIEKKTEKEKDALIHNKKTIGKILKKQKKQPKSTKKIIQEIPEEQTEQNREEESDSILDLMIKSGKEISFKLSYDNKKQLEDEKIDEIENLSEDAKDKIIFVVDGDNLVDNNKLITRLKPYAEKGRFSLFFKTENEDSLENAKLLVEKIFGAGMNSAKTMISLGTATTENVFAKLFGERNILTEYFTEGYESKFENVFGTVEAKKVAKFLKDLLTGKMKSYDELTSYITLNKTKEDGDIKKIISALEEIEKSISKNPQTYYLSPEEKIAVLRQYVMGTFMSYIENNFDEFYEYPEYKSDKFIDIKQMNSNMKNQILHRALFILIEEDKKKPNENIDNDKESLPKIPKWLEIEGISQDDIGILFKDKTFTDEILNVKKYDEFLEVLNEKYKTETDVEKKEMVNKVIEQIKSKTEEVYLKEFINVAKEYGLKEEKFKGIETMQDFFNMIENIDENIDNIKNEYEFFTSEKGDTFYKNINEMFASIMLYKKLTGIKQPDNGKQKIPVDASLLEVMLDKKNIYKFIHREQIIALGEMNNRELYNIVATKYSEIISKAERNGQEINLATIVDNVDNMEDNLKQELWLRIVNAHDKYIKIADEVTNLFETNKDTSLSLDASILKNVKRQLKLPEDFDTGDIKVFDAGLEYTLANYPQIIVNLLTTEDKRLLLQRMIKNEIDSSDMEITKKLFDKMNDPHKIMKDRLFKDFIKENKVIVAKNKKLLKQKIEELRNKKYKSTLKDDLFALAKRYEVKESVYKNCKTKKDFQEMIKTLKSKDIKFREYFDTEDDWLKFVKEFNKIYVSRMIFNALLEQENSEEQSNEYKEMPCGKKTLDCLGEMDNRKLFVNVKNNISTKLQELNVQGDELNNKETLSDLVQYVRNNTNEDISLYYNDIKNIIVDKYNSVKAECDFYSKNLSKTQLQLNDKNIGDNGIEQLKTALIKDKTIKIEDIEIKQLEKEGQKFLFVEHKDILNNMISKKYRKPIDNMDDAAVYKYFQEAMRAIDGDDMIKSLKFAFNSNINTINAREYDEFGIHKDAFKYLLVKEESFVDSCIKQLNEIYSDLLLSKSSVSGEKKYANFLQKLQAVMDSDSAGIVDRKRVDEILKSIKKEMNKHSNKQIISAQDDENKIVKIERIYQIAEDEFKKAEIYDEGLTAEHFEKTKMKTEDIFNLYKAFAETHPKCYKYLKKGTKEDQKEYRDSIINNIAKMVIYAKEFVTRMKTTGFFVNGNKLSEYSENTIDLLGYMPKNNANFYTELKNYVQNKLPNRDKNDMQYKDFDKLKNLSGLLKFIKKSTLSPDLQRSIQKMIEDEIQFYIKINEMYDNAQREPRKEAEINYNIEKNKTEEIIKDLYPKLKLSLPGNIQVNDFSFNDKFLKGLDKMFKDFSNNNTYKTYKTNLIPNDIIGQVTNDTTLSDILNKVVGIDSDEAIAKIENILRNCILVGENDQDKIQNGIYYTDFNFLVNESKNFVAFLDVCITNFNNKIMDENFKNTEEDNANLKGYIKALKRQIYENKGIIVPENSINISVREIEQNWAKYIYDCIVSEIDGKPIVKLKDIDTSINGYRDILQKELISFINRYIKDNKTGSLQEGVKQILNTEVSKSISALSAQTNSKVLSFDDVQKLKYGEVLNEAKESDSEEIKEEKRQEIEKRKKEVIDDMYFEIKLLLEDNLVPIATNKPGRIDMIRAAKSIARKA